MRNTTVKVVSDTHGTYTADSGQVMALLGIHYGSNASLQMLRNYANGVCGFTEGENAFGDDDAITCIVAIVDSGNYSVQHYSSFIAQRFN